MFQETVLSTIVTTPSSLKMAPPASPWFLVKVQLETVKVPALKIPPPAANSFQ